jgi:hypothetical protein
MSVLVGIAISVGVLAGLWGQFSPALGLVTWVGFVAWASFYAAGGKGEGLKLSLAANLSGVIWAFLMVQVAAWFNISPLMGTTIAIGAAGMVLQSKIKLLSFIPGAFMGCSCAFGMGLNIQATVPALLAGGVLGFASEYLGVQLSKATGKSQTPAPG